MSGSDPYARYMQRTYPYFVQRGRGLPWPGINSWEVNSNTSDLMRNILLTDMPNTPYPPFFNTYMNVGVIGDIFNTIYGLNDFNSANSRFSAARGSTSTHGCSLASGDGVMRVDNIPSGAYDYVFKAQADAFFAPLTGVPYKYLLIRPSYELQIGTTPGNWNTGIPGQNQWDIAWGVAFKKAMAYVSSMMKDYTARTYPGCTVLWGFDVVQLSWANYVNGQDLGHLEPPPGVCDWVGCDNYGPQEWTNEDTDFSQCPNTIAQMNPTGTRTTPWVFSPSQWNADGAASYAPNAPLRNMMQAVSYCDIAPGLPSGGGGCHLFHSSNYPNAAADPASIIGSCYRLSTDQSKPLPFIMAETGFVAKIPGWGGGGVGGPTTPSGYEDGGADNFAVAIGNPPSDGYYISNVRNFWPQMKQIWGAISDTGVPLGCAVCWTGENGSAMAGSHSAVGGFPLGNNMINDFDNMLGLAAVPLSGGANPFVSIQTPTNVLTNVSFSVAAAVGNSTATLSAFTYNDDGGSFLAMPTGATLSGGFLSFTHPGMTAGSHTVGVHDATDNLTSTTQPFTVTTPVVPTGPSGLGSSIADGTCLWDAMVVPVTSQGTGTITVTPYAHCFPNSGTVMADANGNPFWSAASGGATTRPFIVPTFDGPTLVASKAIPPYNLAADSVAPGNVAPIYSAGAAPPLWSLTTANDAPGDERLGPLPNDHVVSLLYQPSDPYYHVKAVSESLLAADLPVMLGDERNGGKPYVTNNGPDKAGGAYPNIAAASSTWSAASTNWKTWSAAIQDINGWNVGTGNWQTVNVPVDTSHLPCMFMVPYLKTGHRVHLDIAAMTANQAVSTASSRNIAIGSTSYYNTVANPQNSGRVRGWAWLTNYLGNLVHVLPDADPIKPYVRDMYNDNSAMLAAYYPSQVTATPNLSSFGMVYSPEWTSLGKVDQAGFNMYIAMVALEAWRNRHPGYLAHLGYLRNNFTMWLNYYLGITPATGTPTPPAGWVVPAAGHAGCLGFVSASTLDYFAAATPFVQNSILATPSAIFAQQAADGGIGSAFFNSCQTPTKFFDINNPTTGTIWGASGYPGSANSYASVARMMFALVAKALPGDALVAQLAAGVETAIAADGGSVWSGTVAGAKENHQGLAIFNDAGAAPPPPAMSVITTTVVPSSIVVSQAYSFVATADQPFSSLANIQWSNAEFGVSPAWASGASGVTKSLSANGRTVTISGFSTAVAGQRSAYVRDISTAITSAGVSFNVTPVKVALPVPFWSDWLAGIRSRRYPWQALFSGAGAVARPPPPKMTLITTAVSPSSIVVSQAYSFTGTADQPFSSLANIQWSNQANGVSPVWVGGAAGITKSLSANGRVVTITGFSTATSGQRTAFVRDTAAGITSAGTSFNIAAAATSTAIFWEDWTGGINYSNRWFGSYPWTAGTGGQDRDGYVVDSANSSLPANITVNKIINGNLEIAAIAAPSGYNTSFTGGTHYNYLTSMLYSRFDTASIRSDGQPYGYHEARIQMPSGAGLMGAYWTYTATTGIGELDINEYYDSFVVTQTCHTATQNNSIFSETNVPDIGNWHIYAMDWQSNTIRFYIDGVQTLSLATPSDLKGPHNIIFSYDMGTDYGVHVSSINPATSVLRCSYVGVWLNKAAADSDPVLIAKRQG